MPIKAKNSGYVLLMTLLLITIVAVAMASVSRQSLKRTIQTSKEAERLQREWAFRSVQHTILKQANDLFDKVEEEASNPQTQLQFEITLGSEQFVFVLADEHTKFNVNTSYTTRGKLMTSESIRLLTATHNNNTILLKPSSAASANLVARPNSPQNQFTLFSQIFPKAKPAELINLNKEKKGLSAKVSCWGNGKANFLRAPRDVMLQACQPYLNSGEVERLVQLREEIPGISLTQAIRELELPKQAQKAAKLLLTDKSETFSIWCIHKTSTRFWHEFAVQSNSAIGSNSANQCLLAW